jgi:hypothetical protein
MMGRDDGLSLMVRQANAGVRGPRPMVQPHADAVGEGLRALQQAYSGVEVAARGDRGREQDVTRFDLRGVDAREVEGRACPGVGNLGGVTVILYTTHPRAQACRGV